jgi:soluble lytic murein transglycosylase-like protein
MHILWIKRMSVGVVIINLVMVCGYLFLPLSALSTPTPVRVQVNMAHHRVEMNMALPSLGLSLFTPPSEELQTSISPYDHWIRVACRKHSLDPALVMAVIHAESRFDPLAVSPKGAIGLMQLSPVVARELGIDDPFDPQINIDGGVRYLKDLLDAFDGDQRLALAAYNAGPTQVYRHNGVPPFKDTKKYIKQVFHYQTFYQKNPIS